VETNHWVEDWIATRCESDKTVTSYRASLEVFADFCEKHGKDLYGIVEEWRQVKRLGENEKDVFLEEWSDLVRTFHTIIRKRYAPLTVKNFLATARSFFGFWRIPIDVELPKRACVIYHNRDLTREELKQILTFASPRDRVIWLIMAESGMRADTAVNLKYWHVKEDFEARRVPMRILLPSASLKDHVGDRWTFIGEDGFRELSEYLKRRLPLKDEDFVFASEKAGKVVGNQFSVASLSVKFNRLVQKLKMDAPRGHKPKSVRMHSLRKYFRNNMRVDSSLVNFWMGHTLGVDAYYITRDVERHRQEYGKGYEFLRIFEPSAVSIAEITAQLRKKDEETKALRETIGKLQNQITELQSERLSFLPEEVKTWRIIVDKIKKVHPEWVVEE
jgi:integrase